MSHRVCVAGAVLLLAISGRGAPFAAQLRLKDGRQFTCQIEDRESNAVVTIRPFGSGTVRERHCIDAIEGLYAPQPPSLTNAWNISSTGELSRALAETKAACAQWKPYDGIKGAWYAPCALAHARLLVHAHRYPEALVLFRALARHPALAAERDAIAVRTTLLAFRLGATNVTAELLATFMANVRSDNERAELCYCIGMAYAQRGKPVDSLMALLKIPVFYRRESAWEASALCLALPSYAALDRQDEYTAACASLLRRYAATPQAIVASNALARFKAGQPLSSLTSLTFYIQEPQ